MEAILKEIRGAFQARLYYLALMLCLALPDICAALESDKEKTSEKQYKAWVKAWLRGHTNAALTPDDLYRLRCGVLHQGRLAHRELGRPGIRYKRVAFAVDVLMQKVYLPNKRSAEVLVININLFCKEMVESVEAWHIAHKDRQIVVDNMKGLVQFRPNGLLPYLDNVPCVS
jgi:hypothetical protein